MKRRILFVDDEPNVLDGLRRMLHAERAHWDMVFVPSVNHALDQLHQDSFDAIVSDINMPGRDGFALLAEVRSSARTKDIPVVILTGANKASYKRRALDMGAADLLNKPIDPVDLVARLRSVIRLKSYEDKLRSQNVILERSVRERTQELANSRLDIIWRLAVAAEYRDEETGNHVMRVGCYSRVLAGSLGLADDFVENIFLAGPLHDIGKIGTPDSILRKPGALTVQEWEIMKQHCAIGAAILGKRPQFMSVYQRWRGRSTDSDPRVSDNPLLSMAESIALTHHERWNGRGYPQGLAGPAIPLESRIVALSDAYDALSTERSYKPAYPESLVREIIDRDTGRHFDPEVCTAFERSVDEFRSIHEEFSEDKCAPEVAGHVS